MSLDHETKSIREAHALMSSLLADVASACPGLDAFEAPLLDSSGVQIADVLDHIGIGPKGNVPSGWREVEAGVWRHPGGGLLPDLVRTNRPHVAIHVDEIESFCRFTKLEANIEGEKGDQYRRAELMDGDVIAVERRGWTSYLMPPPSSRRKRRAQVHRQILRSRKRHFKEAGAGFKHLRRLVDALVVDLGEEWARHVFLSAEREYWQSHCTAGLLQGLRQQRTGIGWSNLGHLAYSASRAQFDATVDIFGKLGFVRAEFMDGAGGAGVQVLRSSGSRDPAVLVEVDVSPDERAKAAYAFDTPLTFLGRAGMWTALHGESLLEGGPSRVGARYRGEAVGALLTADAIDGEVCGPASPNAHGLHTLAQLRAVCPSRVEMLYDAGFLSPDLVQAVALNGAPATQLHVIERVGAFSTLDLSGLITGLEGWSLGAGGSQRVPRIRHRIRVRTSTRSGLSN